MKIYFDRKRNDITIIASPTEECPSVSFVEDRYGRKPRKWEKTPRYRVHHSSINEGYSTSTDKLYSIENAERVYAITHDVNAYSQYTQSQPFIDKDKALVEKQLKALEIIRNRCVNTYDEIFSCDTYEEYKSTYHYSQEKFNLTEEEWKLLKEVLL